MKQVVIGFRSKPSGQGSQYVGMGKQLYGSEPVFREAIDRCAQLLDMPLLEARARGGGFGRFRARNVAGRNVPWELEMKRRPNKKDSQPQNWDLC